MCDKRPGASDLIHVARVRLEADEGDRFICTHCLDRDFYSTYQGQPKIIVPIEELTRLTKLTLTEPDRSF